MASSEMITIEKERFEELVLRVETLERIILKRKRSLFTNNNKRQRNDNSIISPDSENKFIVLSHIYSHLSSDAKANELLEAIDVEDFLSNDMSKYEETKKAILALMDYFAYVLIQSRRYVHQIIMQSIISRRTKHKILPENEKKLEQAADLKEFLSKNFGKKITLQWFYYQRILLYMKETREYMDDDSS